MGNGAYADAYAPMQVVVTRNASAGVTDISAGYVTACAIHDGDVYCWGSCNNYVCGVAAKDELAANQTPPPPTTNVPLLVDRLPTHKTWAQVTVGDTQACALEEGGDSIWCWG